MAALCKVHAEYGIARLKQREIYGKVRLCAGVRLHIGMLCAEQTCKHAHERCFPQYLHTAQPP